MKKYLIILISAILFASIASCDSNSDILETIELIEKEADDSSNDDSSNDDSSNDDSSNDDSSNDDSSNDDSSNDDSSNDDSSNDDSSNDDSSNDDSSNDDSSNDENNENYKLELFKVNNTKETSPTYFSKKLLLEKMTATWCYTCPIMEKTIRSSVSRNSNIIPVGMHYNDEMGTNTANILKAKFNALSFPHGQLNRLNKWSTWGYYELNRYTQAESNLGISLTSSYENSTIKGVMKYGISNETNTSLSYVIYILENDLHYAQTDGDDLHNNVFRKCITDIYGNKIAPEFTVQSKVYSIGFEWKLDESKYKHENIDIVAFILNDETGEVLNVQKVKLGEITYFD